MTMTTEVINSSDKELVLKEGNAGVFRKLALLQVRGRPQCRFRITLEVNATYREYWVASGTKNDDQAQISISSDDCLECETIYIINDPNDSTKVTTELIERGRNGRTELVNRTGGVAKLKAQLKDGTSDEKAIPSNEKIFLQPGSKACSVELADGKTILISNEEVARNQRVDITTAPGSQDPKLDMVMRGLYVTEVTNRSKVEIQVNHLKGSGGVATVLDTHQIPITKSHTIKYDPKKKDHYYSVEPSNATQVLNLTSSDLSDFTTIDVIDGKSAGMIELRMLKARPSANKQKDGFLSRTFGCLWLKA